MPAGARLRATVGPAISSVCRLASALLRSVHELLWAVLFLAAFGITPLAALVAIALPYAGVFAKVYAEILQQLFHNGWVNLVALDPKAFEFHRYYNDATWAPLQL